MFLAEIPYPAIDPIAFHVFGFPIRWYGLSYVAAFIIANFLLRRLARDRVFPAPPEAVGDLLFATILGVILGGRLGYALIYKPGLYLAHPGELVRIWEGGLSFHGGLIGVAVALVLYSRLRSRRGGLWRRVGLRHGLAPLLTGRLLVARRRRPIPLARLMDACSLAAPPGIFLVRLANFINGELWGRPSSVPWAMRFPDPEAGNVPRHPSQIYEALLEGAGLFILLWGNRRHPGLAPKGRTAALFVISYGSVRFLVEFTREPDRFLGVILGPLSMGQVLCAAMLAVGIVWWIRSGRTQGSAVAVPGP